MMKHCCKFRFRSIGVLALLATGCAGVPGSTDTTGQDGGTLGFKGVLAGTVSDSRSTRESVDGTAAQQSLPLEVNPDLVVISFEDLAGDPLLNVSGNPFPPASADITGAFLIIDLPVGIDFVVAVDLDGDGSIDVRQVVQIPADETGVAGSISDVTVDPLTTLVVAKLRDILQQSGVSLDDLDISPTVIVQRVVDTFIHMFEESGVVLDINIDDIADLTEEDIAALFESIIPPAAQVGVDTVAGNLALQGARELAGAVAAAAEVFLRAGFPIADELGGSDLSFLGALPGVKTLTLDQLHPLDPSEPVIDGTVTVQAIVDGAGPVIYFSAVNEPDRNFIGNVDFNFEEGLPPRPIINEFLLTRMAALHLEDREITLRNLLRLLTDAEVGFGARLTYFRPGDGLDGRPLFVFETADGEGIARDVDALLFSLFESGSLDPTLGFDDLASKEDAIRQAIRELVVGTVPPSLEQLFGPILRSRIGGAEELFTFIRKAKAHLPFSRSGPSTFYVVADGDPFDTTAGVVNAISVDILFGSTGLPELVTHNPTNTGQYFLGFTRDTELSNFVEVLTRETGRVLHGPNGEPVFLNMGDIVLFESVNSVPFADFVSKEGTFWPGANVSVANPDHRIDDGLNNQDIQLFVLASSAGPGAEPVRVRFDLVTGTFSSDVNGRYFLMFVEQTESQKLFGLFDTELGFMVSESDLTGDFFIDSTASIDGTVTTDPVTGQEPPTTTDPIPLPDFVPKLLTTGEVAGLTVQPEFFRFVFGTEVPNENFDASGNPYFDDVNTNGIEDVGEFTSDFRPVLFNTADWRSTDITRYYRRQSGASVGFDEIDFNSTDARTFDGEALVARNFLPRLNAFRFGRPNAAINLLTTFLPPEFFNGTNGFTADTKLGIFQAIAMINLVMEQVFNVEGVIDFDGSGPLPPQRILTDAELFIMPIGDPFVLLLQGFEALSARDTQ